MGTRFAKSAFGYFLIWGICTSLTTTICTIVDALLVGNLVGSSGLAVANLSTPVFLFYAMLGVTVGVGANVRIGRFLGSSDLAQANRVFSAQLALGLLIGAVCLLPLTFRDAYFAFLGVTPELYPLAQQYLTVVMWSAPLFVLYHIFSASVRTDSDPKLAAAASAAVASVQSVFPASSVMVYKYTVRILPPRLFMRSFAACSSASIYSSASLTAVLMQLLFPR